jgi:predicted DNA-binding transcriptional regulator AlpA
MPDVTFERETRPSARKLTTRALCERYDVCDRTIDRWVDTGILPEPMYINKRRYWDEAEVEERERQRMSARADTGSRAEAVFGNSG